eukprot:3507139-Rhodomonas_salina.2
MTGLPLVPVPARVPGYPGYSSPGPTRVPPGTRVICGRTRGHRNDKAFLLVQVGGYPVPGVPVPGISNFFVVKIRIWYGG